MEYNRHRRREALTKKVQCSCGGESRLIKKRKSKGICYMFYRCKVCNKEVPLNKPREAKK
jgi:hypothetical protein